MLFFAAAAFASGAALGVGLVASSRALKGLSLTFEPDEMHWARTEDGWELPLGRYRPRGTRAIREPIILCHGMGANRFNLDLNETYSVARYLSARGFETYVVELRGNGLTRRTSKGSYYSFNFDDTAQKDVPTLIARAKEISGAAKAFWVGHSNGGIVAYGYCGSGERSADLAGIVAIGSPMIGDGHFDPRVERLLLLGSRLMLLDAIYAAPVVRALAPLGRTGRLKVRFMAVGENIDPDVAAWAMANLLGNVSTGVTKQFVRWVETGRFTSWDGEVDYRAGLRSSKVPCLLIAGPADLLAPPKSVESARDAMPKASVDYLLASIENGFAVDYGHGDLVLGRDAPREIFPRIESWLRKRGTPV